MDKDEWGTPQSFFNDLDETFNFSLDPCGTTLRRLKATNKMVTLTKAIDGLQATWEGQSVFVNPPYSGKQLEQWVKKCYGERHKATDIVLIMPSNRTGTRYFHKYVLGSAEIAFVPGRLQFVPLAGQKVGSNPMNTIIAVWQSSNDGKAEELMGRINDFEGD